MALSFNTVKQAYTVFNALKKDHLPNLRIPSWPDDMAEWSQEKKDNPPLNVVLGWGKKYDNGWESIAFFVENPSKELIEAFHRLNDIRGNTCICGPYQNDDNFWCIGWF